MSFHVRAKKLQLATTAPLLVASSACGNVGEPLSVQSAVYPNSTRQLARYAL
jgi:hypothetical protein